MTEAPVLRVVRGDATAEEVAALLVVLSAAGRAPRRGTARPPSSWAARADAVPRPPTPGPNAWRASALPR